MVRTEAEIEPLRKVGDRELFQALGTCIAPSLVLDVRWRTDLTFARPTSRDCEQQLGGVDPWDRLSMHHRSTRHPNRKGHRQAVVVASCSASNARV